MFAGTVFRSVTNRVRDAGVCLGLFVDAIWDVGWQLQAQRRSLPAADNRCGGLLLLKVDEMGIAPWAAGSRRSRRWRGRAITCASTHQSWAKSLQRLRTWQLCFPMVRRHQSTVWQWDVACANAFQQALVGRAELNPVRD